MAGNYDNALHAQVAANMILIALRNVKPVMVQAKSVTNHYKIVSISQSRLSRLQHSSLQTQCPECKGSICPGRYDKDVEKE